MNIGLIEDEIPAQQHLTALLKSARPAARVAWQARSILEAVEALAAHEPVDLLLMDIQLNDGLSLEIFDRVQVNVPVIFATAYDQYLLEAFHRNGIDYLLKPIRLQDLLEALGKYDRMRAHFMRDWQAMATAWLGHAREERVLCRRGAHFVAVSVSELSYFFSEHKITFAVTRSGERLMTDLTLAELEAKLDAALFFRANRQFLVHVDAIRQFTPNGKGGVVLTLHTECKEEVLVSQDRGAAFKGWISGMGNG